MTLKNGKYLGTVPGQPYQVKNLTWFATCTHNITNIHYTNPAPATPLKSKDG